MKFKLTQSSTIEYSDIEIETLDELLAFISSTGKGRVVIQRYFNDNSLFEIEIYDCYRE